MYNRKMVTFAVILRKIGFKNHDSVSRNIQKLRRQARLTTGFNPASVSIPKRFTEITTWNGKLDAEFLSALKNANARRLLEMTRGEDHS